MQNYRNQRRSKRAVLITIIGVVLIVGALIAGYILIHKQPSKTASTVPKSSGPTIAQQQQQDAAYAQQKKQAIENPPATQPSNPAPVSSSNIVLSAKQESNGSVTVFTKLPGVSDGACTLIVTNGTKSTTQTAAVIYQPQYSTCAGFSVPITSVGTGSWTVKLTLDSRGSSNSTSISQEVH